MPILDWFNKKEALKTADKTPYKVLVENKELSYGDQTQGNMLIKGDNLEALKALLPYYKGRVKCIYIDPPYNTGSAFEHYDDNLEHSTWLSMMYPRLELLRELLAEDGIIVAQIDDNEQAYLKVMMDEIFDRKNFINCISVNMSNMSGPKIQHAINGLRFPKIKEYLLIYAKSAHYHLTIPKISKTEWDEEYNLIIPDLTDEDAKNIEYYLANKDIEKLNQVVSKYKLCSRKEIEKKLPRNVDVNQWRQENIFRIFASKPNKALSRKAFQLEFSQQLYFLTNPTGDIKLIRTDFNRDTETQRIELCCANEHQNIFLGDVWDDIVTTGGVAQEGNVTFKASKKPEKLIWRLISAITNPRDLVLDSFLGSGTTAAVAQKMGRKYIGIEMGEHAITHCAPRLKQVIDGTDQGGISKTTNWKGGGGFTFYDLGKPIFDEEGNINHGISFKDLAFHVWFSETKTPMQDYKYSPLLGVYKDTAYYLLYNGVLGDKRVNGGNVLTSKVLESLPPFDGPKVIYGESCRLSPERLKKENIIFKQTPYEITAR